MTSKVSAVFLCGVVCACLTNQANAHAPTSHGMVRIGMPVDSQPGGVETTQHGQQQSTFELRTLYLRRSAPMESALPPPFPTETRTEHLLRYEAYGRLRLSDRVALFAALPVWQRAESAHVDARAGLGDVRAGLSWGRNFGQTLRHSLAGTLRASLPTGSTASGFGAGSAFSQLSAEYQGANGRVFYGLESGLAWAWSNQVRLLLDGGASVGVWATRLMALFTGVSVQGTLRDDVMAGSGYLGDYGNDDLLLMITPGLSVRASDRLAIRFAGHLPLNRNRDFKAGASVSFGWTFDGHRANPLATDAPDTSLVSVAMNADGAPAGAPPARYSHRIP